MHRLFLSVRGKRCAFGCTYCFADFSQYDAPPSLEEVEAGEVELAGIDVIYPACDVDLFAMRTRWADVVARSVRLGRSVSLSTKAPLTSDQIEALGGWGNYMRDRGLVLKIGVSASTMRRCAEIEPRAASWDQRLDALRRLGAVGVPTCLVLKPVLGDIPLHEYRQMIDAVSSHTPAVILGDEYVDDELKLRRRADTDLNHLLGSREVRWIEGSPRWLVRESRGRLLALAEHAESLDMRAYLSDLHYMEDLVSSTSVPTRPVLLR